MRNNPFSIGFTLKELSLNTTNSDFENQFFDRNLSENKDKPIYKKLRVDNFAFYLLCNDKFHLSNTYKSTSMTPEEVEE